MPNGDEINDRLEFKKRIRDLPPDECRVEIALMVYDMKVQMDEKLNGGFSKKQSALVSIISSVVTAVCAFLAAKFNIGGAS